MFKLVRSPNCMSDFIKTIESLAYDFHNRKQQYQVFTGQLDQTTSEVKACWICGLDYNAQEIKLLDQCHYSDDFIGWAHNTCNLKRRSLIFTRVVAHNLSNYDLHHICQAIQYCSSKSKLRVFPQSDENYICLIIRVKVGEYKNKKGEVIDFSKICASLTPSVSLECHLKLGFNWFQFRLQMDLKVLITILKRYLRKKQIKLLHRKSFF